MTDLLKNQPTHREHPGTPVTWWNQLPATSCAWCSNTGRIADDIPCRRCNEAKPETLTIETEAAP